MRAQSGLTLVETLVALLLLGIAILLAATVVLRAQVTQRRALRRAVAVGLADGAAERVRAMPYYLVVDEELDLGGEPAARDLPGAKLVIEVEEDEDLELKNVVIEVSWTGRDHGAVRLATAVGSLGLYR